MAENNRIMIAEASPDLVEDAALFREVINLLREVFVDRGPENRIQQRCDSPPSVCRGYLDEMRSPLLGEEQVVTLVEFADT